VLPLREKEFCCFVCVAFFVRIGDGLTRRPFTACCTKKILLYTAFDLIISSCAVPNLASFALFFATMMKLAALSALVASASAFAPASHQKAGSALSATASPYADDVGATKPVRFSLSSFRV